MGKKEFTLRQNGNDRKISVEDIRSTAEKSSNEASVLLIKFSGINDPETAKYLTGAELVMDRVNAVPLKQGEYYIEDLIGLRLEADGQTLGHICGMVEGGGGDMAEVKLPNGDKKFIPFRDEFIGKVDIEAGTAVLLHRWILE